MSGGGCVVEELEQLWRREAVGSTTPVGPTATEGTVGRAGGTGEGGVGSVEATVKRSADAGLSVEELKRIRLGSLGELEQPELALQEGEKGLEGQDVIPLGSPEDMAEADQVRPTFALGKPFFGPMGCLDGRTQNTREYRFLKLGTSTPALSSCGRVGSFLNWLLELVVPPPIACLLTFQGPFH